jgi:tetratricopeptide (TPR) repeat protein
MHIDSPAAFINKLILTPEAMGAYAAGASLHTDGNAQLEYSAPKALVREYSPQLLAELYRYRTKPEALLRSLPWLELRPSAENDLSAMFQAKQEILGGIIENASKGSTKAVLDRFEKALRIHPGDYYGTFMLASAYYELGSAFEGARRPAEAIPAYAKCTGAIDNFIASSRGVLTDYFRLDVIYAKANFQLGTLALKANRLEQAAAAFEDALSGAVRYADAYNNLGIVYERSGKYDAAATQYQLAIDLAPNLISAYMNLGNTLLKQKKYQEAILSYSRIKELKPDFALTNYNLGMAYFRQEQWQKAAAEWERALALKPDFAQARQGLKAVRQKMEKR